MRLKIAAFASHGGSNIQAIIDGIKKRELDGEITVIISNNSDSYVKKRAEKEAIPFYHISSVKDKNVEEKMLKILKEHGVNLIILAGYMKKLPEGVINQYRHHLLNIHPALLPSYGGKGMYGLKVHQAVIEAKEKYSGVTVHLVNENYDEGEILNQVKVKVKKGDTAESLAERVLKAEHKIYLETLIMISNGKIVLK